MSKALTDFHNNESQPLSGNDLDDEELLAASKWPGCARIRTEHVHRLFNVLHVMNEKNRPDMQRKARGFMNEYVNSLEHLKDLGQEFRWMARIPQEPPCARQCVFCPASYPIIP